MEPKNRADRTIRVLEKNQRRRNTPLATAPLGPVTTGPLGHSTSPHLIPLPIQSAPQLRPPLATPQETGRQQTLSSTPAARSTTAREQRASARRAAEPASGAVSAASVAECERRRRLRVASTHRGGLMVASGGASNESAGQLLDWMKAYVHLAAS